MSKNLEEHGFTLVDLPNGKRAIGTKWVFKNKKDERGIVIRDKARLVAQGYTQKEGIDYDEVFAPIARIEAIRLFLAYASFKDFVVYQMNVKSAFLYETIEEEVYVCQPPGFEDPEFPDRVYKVEKALYGLHQALRAWYETLSTYLLDNEFQKGKIDKTFFIKRLMIRLIDDLTFTDMSYLKGQPKLGLCYLKDSPFDLVAYTHSDYVGASFDRKYTTGVILNTVSFGLLSKPKTVNGEVQLQALVDGKKIIITESTVRRDLQLEDAEGVDCLPNSTIFEQLTLMGYEKISQKLTFYKAFFSPQWKFLIHTILQCLSSKTTAWNEFSSTMASAIICLATNQKFNFSKYIFESMVKNLDNVGKFLMYPRFIQVFLDKQLEGMPTHNRIYIAPSHTKKIFGNMRRVGKGFSGRETPLFQTMVVQDQAEMGEGSANPTDPHHTPTFIQPSTSQPQKKQKPRKPKRKDTQIPQSSGPTEHVADEAVYKELDDSLVRVATTASSLEAEQDSGNIAKTRSKATPNESSSLGTTSGGGPRRQETMGDTMLKLGLRMYLNIPMIYFSQEGRINAIDVDEDITLVNDQDDADMFDVNTLTALVALKSVKPKVKANVVEKPSVPVSAASIKVSAATITTATISTPRKGIVITELAEFDEEERLAREKDEANVALTKEWDDIQAKVDAKLLDQRRKHFAAIRTEEKRNKPPTKTQQNKTMITYLKNMEDLVEGSSKRAGYELEQEVTKKQKVDDVQETAKVDDDQEAAKIKELMEIVPDEEEVAIDAIPLATKPPTIVD
ncbi:retrovirus-related pol polyprotein from transposon TNT 1-94 [Tanacetum coccineum]